MFNSMSDKTASKINLIGVICTGIGLLGSVASFLVGDKIKEKRLRDEVAKQLANKD